MRINATQVIEMDRRLGMIDKTLEKLAQQVHVKISDTRPGVIDMVDKAGTPGQIDHRTRQRFVQRDIGMPIPIQSGLVPDRLRKRLTENDSDVFDSVVCIDLQISLRSDVQIHHAMACNLREHMVKKRNSGGELVVTRSIQIQPQADAGFLGVTFH